MMMFKNDIFKELFQLGISQGSLKNINMKNYKLIKVNLFAGQLFCKTFGSHPYIVYHAFKLAIPQDFQA